MAEVTSILSSEWTASKGVKLRLQVWPGDVPCFAEFPDLVSKPDGQQSPEQHVGRFPTRIPKIIWNRLCEPNAVLPQG